MKGKMKTRITFMIIAAMAYFTSCQQVEQTGSTPERKAAIKVAIMYPNVEGKAFNMDYYANSHMPMVAELFGDSLITYSIDQGISGRTSEDTADYIAIGTFYFEKLSAYGNSFGPNEEQILSDIPNYTDIQPIVQISKVID